MKRILVLHGPNLNRLGYREPKIYGYSTLENLNVLLQKQAIKYDIFVTSKQSNSESKLIKWIHEAIDKQFIYLIINPAALTHTSISLRDALLSVNIPFIEVHISNIYSRESFRKISYFSDIAIRVISGFGIRGYMFALQSIIEEITNTMSNLK